MQGTDSKSAFGTFAGFKTTPVTNPPVSSLFSFLANTSATSSTTSVAPTTVNTSSKNIAANGAPKTVGKDANKKEDTEEVQILSSTSSSKKVSTEQKNEKTKSHSSDYYAKLKGLNESVATWIKTHVDENPFCILTPIFRDYEKYLKEITSKEESTKQTSHVLHATQVRQNDNEKDITIEKKLDNCPFANSNANAKSASTAATEWKPEKSILFSNIATTTKSIFGNTEQKTENSPKPVFSNVDTIPDKGRSIFDKVESNVAGKNIFSSSNTENPFLNKSATLNDGKTDEEETKSNVKSVAPTFPASTFSFGQSSTTSNVTAGFSFGR